MHPATSFHGGEPRPIGERARKVSQVGRTVAPWATAARSSNRSRRGRCELRGPKRNTHPASIAKHRQIAELDTSGLQRIGTLSDDAFLAAGLALYAGEGSKRDGAT